LSITIKHCFPCWFSLFLKLFFIFFRDVSFSTDYITKQGKMTRLQFHQLLKRYLDKESTQEELDIIESWYELLDNESISDLSSKELDDIEGRLWHKIQGQTIYKPQTNELSSTKVITFNWKKYAVAAAIILAMASSVIYFILPSFQQRTLADLIPKQGYRVLHNSKNNLLNLTLNDGSTVQLKSGSTIHYPIIFAGDKREVFIEGEVFFDIAKNPSKPFYVYENNIVTHVIGTSFWIKPDDGKKQYNVEVVSGRVEVYENEKLVNLNGDNSNGVILTPNQKVVYTPNQRKFEATIVSKPVLVSTKEVKQLKDRLVFDEAQVSTVLSLLQKMYGIEIVVENEAINNCPFTGDISELDMYKQLDLLCKSIGKTFEIKGTKILIKGNGCN